MIRMMDEAAPVISRTGGFKIELPFEIIHSDFVVSLREAVRLRGFSWADDLILIINKSTHKFVLAMRGDRNTAVPFRHFSEKPDFGNIPITADEFARRIKPAIDEARDIKQGIRDEKTAERNETTRQNEYRKSLAKFYKKKGLGFTAKMIETGRIRVAAPEGR